MTWGILQAILHSIGSICQKRATGFGVHATVFLAMGYASYFLLAIVVLFLGKLPNPVTFGWSVIGLMLLIMALKWIERLCTIYAVAREKVSVLQPFTYINKIVVILGGALILGEKGGPALAAAVISLFIVIIYAIVEMRGSLRFTNGLISMIAAGLIGGIRVMLLAVALGYMSSYVYASYQGIVFFLVPTTILILGGHGKTFFGYEKGYYVPRFVMAFTGLFGFLINLFLIQNLGIIRTTLISFIALVVTLIFAALFLGDQPKKGDIIVSFAVLVVIATGYGLDLLLS